MQYCNKSLIKNNNEILQYFNKNNDIALVMHQRALLDMSDTDTYRLSVRTLVIIQVLFQFSSQGPNYPDSFKELKNYNSDSLFIHIRQAEGATENSQQKHSSTKKYAGQVYLIQV